MLTAERLRELLRYDPETGVFTWIARPCNRIRIGERAGSKSGKRGDERLSIQIDGKHHKAHRLAWLYQKGSWPEGEIDHENMDGLDNRWTNLRDATRSQNNANRRAYKNNRLGIKGVRRLPSGSYEAAIKVKDCQIYLGCHATQEQAHKAYADAAAAHYREFARAG